MNENAIPGRLRRLAGLSRWTLLGLLATAALGMAACDEDGEDEVDPEATLVDPIEFTVTDDALEPEELRLTAPDQVHVIVENRSEQDCMFVLGPFLEMDVAAGATESLRVELDEIGAIGEESVENIGDDRRYEMGCLDDGRDGMLLLVPTTG